MHYYFTFHAFLKYSTYSTQRKTLVVRQQRLRRSRKKRPLLLLLLIRKQRRYRIIANPLYSASLPTYGRGLYTSLIKLRTAFQKTIVVRKILLNIFARSSSPFIQKLPTTIQIYICILELGEFFYINRRAYLRLLRASQISATLLDFNLNNRVML